MVKLEHIFVIESLQNLNLTQQPRLFGRGQTVNFDLVPRDVHALLFVKRLVHILVRAASEKLCGPPEASSRIPLNKLGSFLLWIVINLRWV